MTSSFSITTYLSHVSIDMTTFGFDLMKTKSNLICGFLGRFPFLRNVNCYQESKSEMSLPHFNHGRISRSLCSLGPLPYSNIVSGFLLVQPSYFHNKQREILSRKTEWKKRLLCFSVLTSVLWALLLFHYPSTCSIEASQIYLDTFDTLTSRIPLKLSSRMHLNDMGLAFT